MWVIWAGVLGCCGIVHWGNLVYYCVLFRHRDMGYCGKLLQVSVTIHYGTKWDVVVDYCGRLLWDVVAI